MFSQAISLSLMFKIWGKIMQVSDKCGICLLCGGVDGECKSGYDKNGFPEYECAYVSKKILIKIHYEKMREDSDVMGWLINEAPNGTTLVEKIDKTSPDNCITLDEVISMIPDMAGKLDSLLVHLYNTRWDPFYPQQLTDVSPHIAYCSAPYEVQGRINALRDLGYIVIDEEWKEDLVNHLIGLKGHFTPAGVFRVEELRSSGKSKKVFIAMAFETDYSKTIKSAVKKGCGMLKLNAETVDEKNYLGSIPDRIISEINKSKFVVADYTGNNPGVYYESGYARGRGIEVIETCNKEWFKKNGLHFDVAQRNMILWDNENDFSEKIRDRLESLQ